MKKLALIFSSKTNFFILTTLAILALNLFPLISHIRHAPEGRTFALIHNNVQDFFFYQSLMNEGANGSWLTYDPYTTESHQPSIIFSYFLWLGKISKLFGLSFSVTYHLSRIILGFLFLLSTFYLLSSVLKVPHPRLTYLFFLFAAPLMNGDKPFMNWWTGMDPIRRVAYLPHHMMGSLLLVITIIFLIKFMQQKNYKYLLYAILITPILAFIHTPSLFILLLILPPAILIYLLTNILTARFTKQTGDTIWGTVGLFIYWIIGLLFMLLMISQTKNGFPWSQYINWEKNLQFPLTRELIGALGILFPFSVIGIWQALRSKKFEYIFTACWLFVPFLIIPFAQKLNISNIRLIQGTPYLPLAILASFGITTIQDILLKMVSLINSKCKMQNAKLQVKMQNYFKFLIVIFNFYFLILHSQIANIIKYNVLMVKYKQWIFVILILLFLIFFEPTSCHLLLIYHPSLFLF